MLCLDSRKTRAGSPSPATAVLLAVALKTKLSSFLKPFVRPDRVPSLLGGGREGEWFLQSSLGPVFGGSESSARGSMFGEAPEECINYKRW